MANGLDEMDESLQNEEGRDIHVIEKKIPATIGTGTKVFEAALWILIIPGLVFQFMKTKAGQYLSQLEQKVNAAASTVDNYLEQRVMILQNAAQLVNKAVALDQETFTKVAELRSGGGAANDALRNQVASQVEDMSRSINLAFERYPELKAHQEIADAMQQNDYLQREITAAREVYNDVILQWNRVIFEWPTKVIVAAKRGYSTRIPFSTSSEVKEKARGTFF